MEIRISGTDFTPERKVLEQLTLLEYVKRVDSDGAEIPTVTEQEDEVSIKAPVCVKDPGSSAMILQSNSGQGCGLAERNGEILPPQQGSKVVISSLPKESTDSLSAGNNRGRCSPVIVEGVSNSFLVIELTNTDGTEFKSEVTPRPHRMVIRRKTRRRVSPRDHTRHVVMVEKEGGVSSSGKVEMESRNQAESKLMQGKQRIPHEESEAELCREQPDSGYISQGVNVVSGSVPQKSKLGGVVDERSSSRDIEMDERSKIESFAISEDHPIAERDGEGLCSELLEPETTAILQPVNKSPRNTRNNGKVQQIFSNAQMKSKDISQAASIKSKSKSKPKTKDLSKKYSNDVKLDGIVCVYSRSRSDTAGDAMETEHLHGTSGEERLASYEEFGNIVDDSMEDGIVMAPSTPQEKEARRLAREKQLKNMRAWEASEMRRERALRRRKRKNGEDDESGSRQENKGRKKIKWKDENTLVSVFEYSPKEEPEDSDSIASIS